MAIWKLSLGISVSINCGKEYLKKKKRFGLKLINFALVKFQKDKMNERNFVDSLSWLSAWLDK